MVVNNFMPQENSKILIIGTGAMGTLCAEAWDNVVVSGKILNSKEDATIPILSIMWDCFRQLSCPTRMRHRRFTRILMGLCIPRWRMDTSYTGSGSVRQIFYITM